MKEIVRPQQRQREYLGVKQGSERGWGSDYLEVKRGIKTGVTMSSQLAG